MQGPTAGEGRGQHLVGAAWNSCPSVPVATMAGRSWVRLCCVLGSGHGLGLLRGGVESRSCMGGPTGSAGGETHRVRVGEHLTELTAQGGFPALIRRDG